MGYKTVRATKPVRHNNVLRVPGQTTGENAQDFVVSDASADRLVALGVITVLGVAAEPEVVEPVGRIFARKRGGVVIGLQDENGLALAAGGASSILSITGVPGVGNVYTAVLAAGWGGFPTYQWLRGVAGANDLVGASTIAGATASTYTQVEADASCLIGCRVAGVTQYSAAATALVPATPVEPVVGVAPAFTTAPAIIGTPTVGVPVSFTPGTVTGTTPITRAVQWLLDGAQIVGETGATYTPISGDATKALSVRETASNGTAPNAVSTSSAAVIAAAGAGGVAVPDLPALASSYSVGLAAATEGGEFYLASPDSLRAYIYRKSGSVADLNRVEPINNRAAIWAARAAIDAASVLPGTPLVNWDAIDALFSVRELRNRSLASFRPLDAMAGIGGLSNDLISINGSTVRTSGLADTMGGNRAVRYQVAAGSPRASSTIFAGVSLPPGRWTFAVDIRIGASAASADVKLSIGTTLGAAVTPTSSWTTVQMTATNTGVWGGSGNFASVGLASAEAVATTVNTIDIEIANWRLVPGASASAVDTVTLPILARAMTSADNFKMSADYGFENTTSAAAPGSNLYVAMFPATKALTSRTYIFAHRGVKASATKLGLLMGGRGAAPDSFGQNQNLSESQVVSYITRNNFGAASRNDTLTSGHPEVVAYRFSAGVWTLFVNGLKVEAFTASHADASLTALLFNAGGSPASPANAYEGTAYGAAIYDSALSDVDVAAASVSMLQRYAARSLATAPKFVYLAEGDSNTAGTGDIVGGYAYRANATLANPVIPANRAVAGAVLGTSGDAAESNSLYGRLAGDISKIQAYQAAGYKVIVSTMIGTNDAPSITTQAQAEEWYGRWMSWVAAVRASGARVIVCSQIPTDQASALAYDRTPVTIGASATAGALAGNSYNGLRRYIRALIARDTANWDDYANIASGNLEDFSLTYYTDEVLDVHLNPAGHAAAAGPLSAALQRVITAWV